MTAARSHTVALGDIDACPVCGAAEVSARMRGLVGYVAGDEFTVFECGRCDASFVHPNEASSATYDTIYGADLYAYSRYAGFADAVGESDDPLRFLARQELPYRAVDRVSRSLAPGSRVLEIGSGRGYLTAAFRAAGFEARGIDISPVAVEHACARFGPWYEAGDVRDFAAAHGPSFDLVVATEVVEHIQDPTEFVRAALALVEPAGKVLLTTPNKDYGAPDAIWQTDLPPLHLTWLGERAIRSMVDQVGGEVRFLDLKRAWLFHENLLEQHLLRRTRPFRSGPAIEQDGTVISSWTKDGASHKVKLRRQLSRSLLVSAACNIVMSTFQPVSPTLAAVITPSERSIQGPVRQ